MRDNSIDIVKGLAIFVVYLGHSIIYHPIDLQEMYSWCSSLGASIFSFNMPLFFIVSGYLFSRTKKTSSTLLKDKMLRLAVPYLVTMSIVMASKFALPSSMSYNDGAGQWYPMLSSWLFNGGERWFVFVLLGVFLLSIPLHRLNMKWGGQIGPHILMIFFLTIIISQCIKFPSIGRLYDLFYYWGFFIVGYGMRDNYQIIKNSDFKWLTYIMFVVLNLCFINDFNKTGMIFRYVLPIIGSIAFIQLSSQIDTLSDTNIFKKSLIYVGKYSLQFYLFTFPYPIIRILLVSKLGMTDPVLIIVSVFILQFITITPIVEITRRIKWLKIPCGY